MKRLQFLLLLKQTTTKQLCPLFTKQVYSINCDRFVVISIKDFHLSQGLVTSVLKFIELPNQKISSGPILDITTAHPI